MKQNLRVGEGYAPARSNLKKRNIRYISLLAVLTSMCLYARAQEDIEWTPAASGQSELPTKGLQVGDTVPDVFIPKILRYHRSSAQLSDYRGKVLILDFWNTHCTICIFNMPHLHQLKNASKGKVEVLPVSSESSQEMQEFFNRGNKYKALEGLRFPSIVECIVLHRIMPEETLTKVVVMNGQGVVRGITQAEYLNTDVLQRLLEGADSVYIPRKRVGFRQPRLAPSLAYDDVKTYGPVYYSAVIGFTDGVSHNVVWERDNMQSLSRLAISNTYLLKLYTYSGRFGALSNKHNRIILEVNEPEKYVFTQEHYRDIEWRRQHWYSYEAVVPSGTELSIAKAKMKDALDMSFNLITGVEQRAMPCLILKPLEGDAAYASKGHSPKIETRYLVAALNKDQFALPLVIDETALDEVVNIDFEKEPLPETVEGWRRRLNEVGLDLVPEMRTI